MGVVSTVLGLSGFGVGVSAGVVIGYYMFIYFQPSDVKVLSLSYYCFWMLLFVVDVKLFNHLDYRGFDEILLWLCT